MDNMSKARFDMHILTPVRDQNFANFDKSTSQGGKATYADVDLPESPLDR